MTSSDDFYIKHYLIHIDRKAVVNMNPNNSLLNAELNDKPNKYSDSVSDLLGDVPVTNRTFRAIRL